MLLDAYGGFARGIHDEIVATGPNDLKTLIVDHLNIEFGGCVHSRPDRHSGTVYYTYFGHFMAGRFWTSSRPKAHLGPLSWTMDRNSGVYYLLYLSADIASIPADELTKRYEATIRDRKDRFPGFHVNHEYGFIAPWDGVPSEGSASMSQENDWNAFSVRCVRD
ncbi:MAG: hypothetical protein JST93_26625 [Acidobacteria bacterium]|nr:hypothetical protein [Acidobacteriota bacterium]